MEIHDYQETQQTLLALNAIAIATDMTGASAVASVMKLQSVIDSLLLPKSLVAASGSYYRLTPKAEALMELMKIGGTKYLFFGADLDAAIMKTFQMAATAFLSQLSKLKEELRVYLTDEHTTPDRIRRLELATDTFVQWPNVLGHDISLDDFKEAAILVCRAEQLRLRTHLEYLEMRASDRAVLDSCNQALEHLTKIEALPALTAFKTTPKPRVTDFVNVGVVNAQKNHRSHDEKFGILTSPALFESDYRNPLMERSRAGGPSR